MHCIALLLAVRLRCVLRAYEFNLRIVGYVLRKVFSLLLWGGGKRSHERISVRYVQWVD